MWSRSDSERSARTTTTEIAGAIPPPPQRRKRGLTLRKGGGRASERELSRIVLGAGMVSEWSRGRCVLLLSRAMEPRCAACSLSRRAVWTRYGFRFRVNNSLTAPIDASATVTPVSPVLRRRALPAFPLVSPPPAQSCGIVDFVDPTGYPVSRRMPGLLFRCFVDSQCGHVVSEITHRHTFTFTQALHTPRRVPHGGGVCARGLEFTPPFFPTGAIRRGASGRARASAAPRRKEVPIPAQTCDGRVPTGW